jgi:hypothetical protein
MPSKRLLLFAAFLLLLLLLPRPLLFSLDAQSIQTTNGFNVTNVQWGTPGNPVEAGAGQQDVPLTITLQYYFSNTGTSVEVALSLPPGFTDTNGLSTTTSYISGSVPSGAVLPLTFYLDIAPGLAIGAYTFPVTITWGVSTSPSVSLSLIQNTNAVVSLKGKVQLQFSSSQPVLTPGTTTQLPIVINNIGTGSASNLSLSISASSSALAPPAVSILSAPFQIPLVAANSSTPISVTIYAPLTSAGSSVTLSVTATYVDSYGNARSIVALLGVYVASMAVPTITLVAQSPLLTPGNVNNVTLVITNTGQLTLNQLVIAVSVPPSISVLSQFPVTVSGLQAGSSVRLGMPLFVSSSLSGTPITISASVTYTNSAGNTGAFTQNLGFYVPISQSPSLGLSGYSYEPSLIYPGMTIASLQVVLVNYGTSPASNVNATLVPSSPVYAISEGSLTRSLGLFPVGQSVTLTYMIGILNSSTSINSTLTLYVQSSGAKPLQFSIPFTEQTKANFQVVSVTAPAINAGDSADEITVSVRNTGLATAQLVTFTMLSSNVFQPSSSGSFASGAQASLGYLAPGQTGNLTFVVTVNSNVKPGSYPLTLAASWTQLGTAQQFTQQSSLTLTVHPSEFQTLNSALGSTVALVVYAIVFIVIVAFLVARRLRGR